jgi:phospholipid-binding lipoprotein MlaA
MNMVVDTHIIRPIALVYDSIVPDFIELRIRNIFDNMAQVTVISNDILQGEWLWATHDSWRFLLNSTFGIGGIFDLATADGYPKREQYFGKTLAKWGFNHSPYLVVPLYGSATAYDMIAYPVDYAFFSVWPYIDSSSVKDNMTLVNILNARADALPYDKAVNDAFDPYIFVRNAYLQNRQNIIDGETTDAHTPEKYD